MALGRTTEVFSQKWQDRLSPATLHTMPATVQLFDPELADSVFNYTTGTWEDNPLAVLYEGKARVQPIRSTSSINNGANDTTVQSVLVSIPITAGKTLNLRPEHRGKVLTAPLMPVLTTFFYVVQEVMDSANPIERTFMFRVDQERTVTDG